VSFNDDYGAQARRTPVSPGPAGPVWADPGLTTTGSTPPRRVDSALVLAIVAFVLLGLLALGVGGYLLLVLGPVAAGIAALMALVPLIGVTLVIAWIDRWEPEPRAALLFALLWGAVASVAMALLFSYGAQIAEQMAGIRQGTGTQVFSTVVQAPIVEEFSKGLGVLLLFWVFRRQFDGPVDGLVYGATVAVGFAFTENIQYFGLALRNSDLSAVSETFLLRAILSPFAHVMFTSCTGIVLGLASRRGGTGIGWFLLGLLPAMFLHALWNSASLVVRDFYSYYLVVQVPLFLLAIGIVLLLRRRERQVTAARLTEYAEAGWFSRNEVALLSSGAGRSQGKAWARRGGFGRQFDRFARDATRLAFTRQRLISGRDGRGARRSEAELLQRVVADRQALAGMPPLPLRGH
jgi:RsiW-degrading membrane proteinase PrsW (M82 family)